MCQKLDRRVALFVAACFCLGLSIVFFTSPDRRQERADQPSPRTRWSSSTAAERHNWYAWHARLREQASEEVLPAGPNRSRLVFVGDSIFELLLGSALGLQSRGAEEYPSILQETFGSQWPAPLVLAASGDQTQHLLWRLSHGELSPSRRADPHSIFILHIGTNNLGSGHDPDQTVAGINALTNWLLKHSKGKVLLTTLLRRNLQPPLCAPRRNRVPFLALIDKVNAGIDSLAVDLGHGPFAHRVGLARCGDASAESASASRAQTAPNALSRDPPVPGGAISSEMMPGGLYTHPPALKYRWLLSCLRTRVEAMDAAKVVSQANTTGRG